MRYTHSSALLASALLALPTLLGSLLPVSAAGNLVQDGNFEQAVTSRSGGATFYGQYGNAGSFDPFWTVTQGTIGIDNNDTYVYGGLKSLYLVADGNTDGVAQTLATTPGASYLLSFYADSDDSTNQFAVLFGGQPVPNSVSSIAANGFPDFTEKAGVNASEFTFYEYRVTASSASTPLEFDGSAGLTLEMDNVSVTPVPEASSAVSFGLLLCLGAAGAARRRKPLL